MNQEIKCSTNENFFIGLYKDFGKTTKLNVHKHATVMYNIYILNIGQIDNPTILIKLRKEMGNVSKRQQPDHRADNIY